MADIIIKPFDGLLTIELYKMISIREEIFVLEQDCVYVDCDGNDPACDHMIVREGTEVIGTLRIVPKGIKYDKVSIGRVVLAKDYRGKGIAADMMTKALEYIKDKYGDIEVVLSGQVYIKKLYENAGFKVISDVYLEDGLDHVKMLYKPVQK